MILDVEFSHRTLFSFNSGRREVVGQLCPVIPPLPVASESLSQREIEAYLGARANGRSLRARNRTLGAPILIQTDPALAQSKPLLGIAHWRYCSFPCRTWIVAGCELYRLRAEPTPEV
jgi:hypothetical protein